MPTIFDTVLRPDGTPVRGVEVRLRLVASLDDSAAPGYVLDEDSEIIGPKFARTDAAGYYEIEGVLPNSDPDLVPANTVYELRYKHPSGEISTRLIAVPDTPGPLWVGSLITDLPGAMPSSPLTLHELVTIDDGAHGGVPGLQDNIDAAVLIETQRATSAEGAIAAALVTHEDDDNAAHAAPAIAFTPTAPLAATNVQAAIMELAAYDKNYVDAQFDALTAADVGFGPFGPIVSTDVQSAIQELEAYANSTFISPSGGTFIGDVHFRSGAPVFDVKAFGAVGDGVADDTAAIQAAINAVLARGGVVFFPAGAYRLTATLDIPGTARNLEFVGGGGKGHSASFGSVGIKEAAVVLLAPPGAAAIQFNVTATTLSHKMAPSFRHFMVAGDGSASQIGIHLYSCANWVIEGVTVANMSGAGAIGAWFEAPTLTTGYGDIYGGSSFNECTTGIQIDNMNGVRMFGGLFDAAHDTVGAVVAGSTAVKVNSGSTHKFIGVNFQAYETAINFLGGGNHDVESCRFECFTTGININVSGVSVRGGSWDNSASGGGGTGILMTANSDHCTLLPGRFTSVGTPIQPAGQFHYIVNQQQLRIGTTTTLTNIMALLKATVNSNRVLGLARQSAAQTADILDIFDSDSTTILSRVDKSGYIMTRKITAPADADLANNEAAWWFDPAAGAAAVRFKGKDATGAAVSFVISQTPVVSVDGRTGVVTLGDRYDALGAAASAVTAHVAAADPHGDRAYADATFIPLAQRGAANGVPTLDGNSKIPTNQLPALAISDTWVVPSQAAMLALTAQRGDVAIRTDQSRSYILTVDDPTVLANWQWLQTPADVVTSVDGRVGVVSLSDLYDAAGSATNAVTTHTALPNAHHNEVHDLVSADHTGAGLTVGHVLRATGAATFGFGQAQHGDLGAVGANDHHTQLHAAAHQVGNADDLSGYFARLGAANSFTAEISFSAAVDFQVRSIAANRALDATDGLVLVDASGGAVTVTLPAASAHAGRIYVVKKTDASANAVTITPAGADATEVASITSQNGVALIFSDGDSKWYSISRQPFTGSPAALGAVAAGTSALFARGDHVHPTTGVGVLAAANVFTVAPQQITIDAAANKGLIVKMAASQSANPIELQNSAGTAVVQYNVTNNDLELTNATGFRAIGATKRAYTVNNAAPYAIMGGGARVTAASASSIALIAQGAASQTANLIEAQNSSATLLFGVTAAGLPKWAAAANVQTTVGAAGGASALPLTPTKYLKIVDDTGTTLVIPAYAAS